jgi:hypothetical protein
MLCLLICFLLSHSSLLLMHQHFAQSMLLGDDEMHFISSAPCGMRQCGAYAHPQAAVAKSTAGKGRITVVASDAGRKFTISSRWRGQSGLHMKL